jgi:tRNA(Ile)-lysidine synthetase-like protein
MYTERHIDALEAALIANRGTVHLADGYRACISADRIKLFCDCDHLDSLRVPVETLPLHILINGKEHVLQRMTREEWNVLKNVHKKFFKYALDYDKIQGSLVVRCRQEGDRFHPVGRRVGKTLKSLFQELSVPTYYRDTLPLLCDDDGIVLLPGVACDGRVCPNDSTKHFLVWLIDSKPSYTLSYLMGENSKDCDITEPKE